VGIRLGDEAPLALFLPITSCTVRGATREETIDLTGMEVLENRSSYLDYWQALAEWAVRVGTVRARDHPTIGYEGPGSNESNLLDSPTIAGAVGDERDAVGNGIELAPTDGIPLFRGQDQWLRGLYAGIVLLALLGVVLALRPALSIALGALSAASLLVFLDRSEAMVHRLHGPPSDRLDVQWELGAYMALAGFAMMVLTGLLRWRAGRVMAPLS
jgi:hypothetical protein